MPKEKQKPTVKLTGNSGNAFYIIGRCLSELRRAGYTQAELKQFEKEATSGNYDNVLQTAMRWCNVK